MKTLPLFTIEQTVETYKYLFAKNPSFGIDVYADDFQATDIILLDDTKAGSQGIPLRFKYFAIFLRLDGETKRTVNQFDYIIKPKSLQLVCPGSVYSFQDITQDSHTYVLLFDRSFIEDDNLSSSVQKEILEFHFKCQKDVSLDLREYARVLSIFEQLSSELREKKDAYNMMSKMLINELLYLLKREKINSGLRQYHTRAEQLSAEFLLLIEQHYNEKKNIYEYADLLGISSKHLSTTVKSTLKYSALYYIHIRIIKEIQYLLCFTHLPIKQIAFMLNFESLSQIGRFFKNYTELSPRKYRLKNKVV